MSSVFVRLVPPPTLPEPPNHQAIGQLPCPVPSSSLSPSQLPMMIQQKRKGLEPDKTPRPGSIAAKRARFTEADSIESSVSSIEEQHASSSLGVVKVVADGGTATQGTADPLQVELQLNKCNALRYRAEEFPRCTACISKLTGETCRFKRLRFLLRAPTSGKIVGFSFGESQTHVSPALDMPSKWNVDLQLTHVERVKRTVAEALLPVLKEEMVHLQLPEVIRRPRETEVRATCDACMTSIFSSSWMCRTCGRETCFDCFAHIKEVAGSDELPESRAMTPPQRERHHRSPFFLPCTKRNRHQPKDFSPVTRFCGTELGQAIEDMEALLVASVVEPSDPPGDRMHDIGSLPSAASLPSGAATANFTATVLASPNRESTHLAAPLPAPSTSSGTESSTVGPPSLGGEAIPSHDTATLSHIQLTEEVFHQVWSSGDPIVVTGVLEKFHVQWTPEYFRSNYGHQKCTIVECQSEISKEVTVARFFSLFGNYENRSRSNWKLKDWPPSADFKTMFPELYDDFVRVTPVPNYVRRDGVLNIASHFPNNTVGPDLGPKMYNAQASFEFEGSKGSTRLHMDMADAVNIMTYASLRADGRPGCAAWDIFKVADTTKLRQFLHKKFAGLCHNDPIHAQKFYLDSVLLAELYRDYGVVSHRIYQKPGEVVFIPAGCAHQVCNLADCIKVACDFVSPENVERCSVLTREFREQNQLKAWKEDVLQLRTMMWFAWLSCVTQEKRLRQPSANNGAISAPSPSSAKSASGPALGVSPSAPPQAPPASVQANDSPSPRLVPLAGPLTPTTTPLPSDELASPLAQAPSQVPSQADGSASTLPVPLPAATTSTTQPSTEPGSPPAPIQCPANPPEMPSGGTVTSAAEPCGTPSEVPVFGASIPVADVSLPLLVNESTNLDETAIIAPSTVPATSSGEVPMVVDSTNAATDTPGASAGSKRTSPEADVNPGLPTKRHKSEESPECAADSETSTVPAPP
ncbi:hypothetical protein LXA43DRAFT_985519 [Ganoderma leucocontextum]|nr:hypothetical protein LXA43DRAFT_985519 [Ganoderma leucocontextum]